MFYFSQSTIKAFEATASSAAAYMDACDSGALQPVDSAYYQSCGALLAKIFSLVDPHSGFPGLLDNSFAAREVAEAMLIAKRLKGNCRVFYPELAELLDKLAA